jgi:histidine triad (HIT) family protein
MASIFSRIISGEIPCYKIAEDEHFIAFLDVNPVAEGHTLVVPKKEVDYIFDLDTETYQNLFLFAQKIAKAIHRAVPCRKVGVSVIGLEVPHTHVHLVPINQISDINFSKQKLTPKPEELQEIQQKIIGYLA